VDNYFTDPQIHSHDGNSFGMGNLGQEGIDKFLETHQCNSMCRKLRLVVPERNPDKTWKVGTGSIAVSRITKKSFASDSSSQGPTWTAKKYDGAVTDAVTRVTKKRGKGEAEGPNSAPAVELTQQQLSTLQAKLVMLIQQHGENLMYYFPNLKVDNLFRSVQRFIVLNLKVCESQSRYISGFCPKLDTDVR